MRKNRLKDLAANPNHISGIYNYCDRWCERCSFTSRCLLYATEQEHPDANDPETRDLNNKKFWRKLHEIFADTAEMISEWAAEAGVDLESVDVSKEMAEHERAMEEARENEMSQTATEYAAAVEHWFREEFATEREIHNDDPAQQTAGDIDVAIAEAAEVIRWYQFFIGVKLMRALSGIAEVDEEEFADDEVLSFDFASDYDDEDEEDIDYDEVMARSALVDANGSTKTALVAIDRSIAAWRALQMLLPEQSDSVKQMIVELDRLRRAVEARFPRARDFIRPGLDEIDSEFTN